MKVILVRCLEESSEPNIICLTYACKDSYLWGISKVVCLIGACELSSSGYVSVFLQSLDGILFIPLSEPVQWEEHRTALPS